MGRLVISLMLVFGIINAGEWLELSQKVEEKDATMAIEFLKADSNLSVKELVLLCDNMIMEFESLIRNKKITFVTQVEPDRFKKLTHCAIVVSHIYGHTEKISYFDEYLDPVLPRFALIGLYGGK